METNEPQSAHRNEPTDRGGGDTEWFYTQRGETYGPVSSADLRAAAHLGFLGPDDMVRRGDHGTWVAARSVRGLFKRVG